MKTIHLGLGSNLDNRAENLRRALSKLAPEIVVEEISPVYETTPMYVAKQAKYLNAVCRARTDLSPGEVLKKVKLIEKEMGEHEHNQPRVIDLDLLFFRNEIIETPGLTVPHPKIAERAFVLVPMNEIAPDFVHPVLGVTMTELLGQLGDISKEVKRTHIIL